MTEHNNTDEVVRLRKGATKAMAPPPSSSTAEAPKDWRAKFLEVYEASGQFYMSAKIAGVTEAKVRALMQKDKRFARAVERRKERYADVLEGQMHKLFFDKSNVLAGFGLLKKHRPQDYVEKHQVQQLNVNINAQPFDDPAVVQKTMLQSWMSATEESRKQLAEWNPGFVAQLLDEEKAMKALPESTEEIVEAEVVTPPQPGASAFHFRARVPQPTPADREGQRITPAT